jgi:hypothetical protein
MARRLGISGLLDLVMLLILLAIVGGGAFLVVNYKMGTRAKLEAMRKQLEEERRNLQMARRHIVNLLGERRAAEVVVLERTVDEAGEAQLRLKFLEYASGGKALPAQTLVVSGEDVYFDAAVVLFEPKDVMEGKRSSLYVFHRVFTDKTRPDSGLELSRLDSQEIPPAYRAEDIPLAAQQKAWDEVRRLLEDENFRARRGVRAVFGQAVHKKLEQNVIYTLSIQDNGGLLIEEKPFPEILK